MNIVILTSKDHFYANHVIKYLLKYFPEEISLVIEQETIIPGKSKFAGLKRYYQTAGWRYVFWQVVKQLSFQCLSFFSQMFGRQNFFYSYKNLIKRDKIANWEKLTNNNLLGEKIRQAKPDLIISIFSKYILKQDLLGISCLVINLHPSWLPNYRGVSPIFWVLALHELKTGVTLHQMDLKIDHGNIISRVEIPIEENDTEHSLYLKCCERGKILIKEAIDFFSTRRCFKSTGPLSEGSYFSLPTKEGVKLFRKNKRKFFTFSEIFRIL